MPDPIASVDFSKLLRPSSSGKPVNSHVVPSVPERKPDFAEMKRAIQGDSPTQPERGEDLSERTRREKV